MTEEYKDISATLEIKVPFFDVDTMGVTWHGNYVKYFEMARCELLDKIDFNYNQMAQTKFSWPVVDLRVKYIRPTRFNQTIEVIATLVEYENRLKIHYMIVDKTSGEKLTEGFSVQVAVNNETGKMSFSSPSDLVEKVEEWSL